MKGAVAVGPTGRSWLLLVATLAVAGCTSLRPVDVPPANLPDEIRRGGVVEPGDSVRVTTKDGRHRDMVVTSVDDEAIRGETAEGGTASIPSNDVASVEKREFSMLKSAALVYIGSPILYVMLIIPLMLLLIVLPA